MKTLLRMSLAAAAVLCLLSAGAQTPAGDAVSDFDYAVDVVERAYAGYPDKTAGREAKYAALKGRLQSEISGDRDVYDAIAEYLGWFDDSHLQTPGAEAYRAKSLRRDTDYAGRMKRYDPQFMHCRVDEDTYLIRFPSCDLTDAEIAGVRAAVAAYRASGCENLVVDIRGNMGGSDNAYEPLLKLLYDHEGTEDAMEYRVSDIAIAHVREFVGNTERGRRKVARMERTPAGEFLEEGKTYRIRYDSVSPVPRRAALIVDGPGGFVGRAVGTRSTGFEPSYDRLRTGQHAGVPRLFELRDTLFPSGHGALDDRARHPFQTDSRGARHRPGGDRSRRAHPAAAAPDAHRQR